MIVIVPLGDVNEGVTEDLIPSLEEIFGQRLCLGEPIDLPKGSWHRDRGQYLASSILAVLSHPAHSGDRVLGVVDVDIFAPELNFVFGQADGAGMRALISLWRLRQEFYGLPPDEDLFHQRVVKEAVHELGHTYGLSHCPDPICVMHFSNSLLDTDLITRRAEFHGLCPWVNEEAAI
jgi:archaemetzincin